MPLIIPDFLVQTPGKLNLTTLTGNNSGSSTWAYILHTDIASLLFGFLPWNSPKKEREAAQEGCGPWSLSVSGLGATNHLPQRYRAVLAGDRRHPSCGWFIEVWEPGWQKHLQDDSRGSWAGTNPCLGVLVVGLFLLGTGLSQPCQP